jgi:hypothetical protein
MVKRFTKALGQLWTLGDTRPATIASVLSGYLWAAFLMFPEETLSRPTYKHMAEVMPQDECWAGLFVIVATLQLWRLYATTNRRSIRFEYGLKIIACSMWSFVGLACMFSLYPPPAAMSDTLVIAFGCWWDLVRYTPCRLCPEVTCETGVCPYDR